MTDGGFGRSLTGSDKFVDGAANDARVGGLSVADLASLVDLLAGETDVLNCGRSSILLRNTAPVVRLRGNLTPILSGVVFVRKPDLRLTLDQQVDALARWAVCGQRVVSTFPRRPPFSLRASLKGINDAD